MELLKTLSAKGLTRTSRVPDGDFLSCMPWDEEILGQELDKSSSAELSPGQEMAKNWKKVLQQKKLCQDMAKDFPGLPQSAKNLLRAKVGLETKVMIFVKWLDLREEMKQKRTNLKLQKKIWKGSKKSYYDQRFKQKISELEEFGQGLWNCSDGSGLELFKKKLARTSKEGHFKKKLGRTSKESTMAT